MSSRKPGYVISVILLAIVLSAPQTIFKVASAWEGISRRYWPLPSLPGMSPKMMCNPLQQLPYWRDKLFHFRHVYHWGKDGFERKIALIDAETGDAKELDISVPVNDIFRAFVVGDRLWIIGNVSTYELIDGVFHKSSLVTQGYPQDRQWILWNGQPTVLRYTRNGIEVSRFENTEWMPVGIVKNTQPNLVEKNVGVPVRLGSRIQVFDSADGIHVFVETNGLLLHYHGLEIEPVSTSAKLRNSETVEEPVDSEDTTSALEPINTDVSMAGWSLIREKPADNVHNRAAVDGLMIEGRPAALILDGTASGHTVGRLYRFDGTKWNEFASYPFPFGTTAFVTVTSRDGQRSYVAVRTYYGVSYVYALEAAGIRETTGSAEIKTFGFAMQSAPTTIPLFYGGVLNAALLLGIILGACMTILMRFYTKPNYEFGVQTVRLAALGWRGFARLIDLGLILGTTIGLGWLMTRGLDWFALAEALNLHVDHPTIPIAARAAKLLAVWLVVIVLAMLTTQAAWGITPGKWLCRLRTVRTSLRPCGFAASLAREIVLFVDCCNFLCWTPGIVSIAFTDKRQRLGDLVADTIVVESELLAPISSIESTS